MTTHLIAFAEGLVMGTVTHAKGGRLTFLYSDNWLASPGAYPLSVSTPCHPASTDSEKSSPSFGASTLTTKLCSDNGRETFTRRPSLDLRPSYASLSGRIFQSLEATKRVGSKQQPVLPAGARPLPGILPCRFSPPGRRIACCACSAIRFL
jgi:HipA-like protein